MFLMSRHETFVSTTLLRNGREKRYGPQIVHASYIHTRSMIFKGQSIRDGTEKIGENKGHILQTSTDD